MAEIPAPERRSRRRLWLVAGLLFVLALLLSFWLVGPAPPRSLRLATGEPEGAYMGLGKDYQKRLHNMGLDIEIHESQGSLDNLRKVLSGEADVALVQAGTYSLIEQEDTDEVLRGLVSIQLEPVWVFYRGDKLEGLTDFHGKTIAIGQKRSGTAVLARQLLRANGLDKKDATFVHRTMKQTQKELLDGSIDIGFFVTSTKNPMVRELLEHEEVHLLSFRRHLAYSQRFEYLTPVVLGEGVLDLEENIPSEDVNMFAVPTLLVCRADLHHVAVEQILIAARKLHSRSTLVSSTRSFPSLEGIDLLIHPTAEAYMHSGESLATRVLPYWGVWLLFKAKLLILPLLVVWLPFFRIVPLLYTFRVNRLLRHHYAVLREIEDNINKAESAEAVREHLATLDELKDTMESVSRKVPTHLQINVYQWRLHVAHVRSEAIERLWHLDQKQSVPKANGSAKNDESVTLDIERSAPG